jgi:hypothetical protein
LEKRVTQIEQQLKDSSRAKWTCPEDPELQKMWMEMVWERERDQCSGTYNGHCCSEHNSSRPHKTTGELLEPKNRVTERRSGPARRLYLKDRRTAMPDRRVSGP